jgi:hypothetical protein
MEEEDYQRWKRRRHRQCPEMKTMGAADIGSGSRRGVADNTHYVNLNGSLAGDANAVRGDGGLPMRVAYRPAHPGIIAQGQGQPSTADEQGTETSSDSWYIPPVRPQHGGRGQCAGRGRGRGRHGGMKARGQAQSYGARMDTANDTQQPQAAPASAQAEPTKDPLSIHYAPETWKKNIHVYSSPPLPFIGPEPGCTHPYGRLPSLPRLFEKFWSPKLQRRIVRETNRYASEIIDDKTGQTQGGQGLDTARPEGVPCILVYMLVHGFEKIAFEEVVLVT